MHHPLLTEDDELDQDPDQSAIERTVAGVTLRLEAAHQDDGWELTLRRSSPTAWVTLQQQFFTYRDPAPVAIWRSFQVTKNPELLLDCSLTSLYMHDLL